MKTVLCVGVVYLRCCPPFSPSASPCGSHSLPSWSAWSFWVGSLRSPRCQRRTGLLLRATGRRAARAEPSRSFLHTTQSHGKTSEKQTRLLVLQWHLWIIIRLVSPAAACLWLRPNFMHHKCKQTTVSFPGGFSRCCYRWHQGEKDKQSNTATAAKLATVQSTR